MQTYVENKLNELVQSFQQLPYVFIGTGMSIRYAHAPNWLSLLYNVWHICNPSKTEKEFNKLYQSIEYALTNEDLSPDEAKHLINPRLATKIEEEFCHKYYNEEAFDSTVFTEEENNDILSNHYNPFKYYVSKQTSSICIDLTLKDTAEIPALSKVQNKIAGIITTNYDRVLEEIFESFSILIGQDNLLFTRSFNIFEIYKIHGCASSPNSIVITEKDYNNFASKLKYLSAKLMTIFVEHPIIFLGYGLGDVNIRNIFTEICSCLNSSQIDQLKNNFIFLTPAIGSQEDSYSLIEKDFGPNSIKMHEFVLNDYSLLFKSLSGIQSSLPIKLARSLQDMVCDYVYSTTAQNKVIFGDINSPDIDESKAAIFFGRADTISQIGFSYYTIDNVLEDILFDDKPYLVDIRLIEQTFKNIRSSAGSTLLPIYKYIHLLHYDIAKIPENYNIVKNINDIHPTTSDTRTYLKNAVNCSSIKEIEQICPNHIPKQVAYIKKYANIIDTEELGDYLRKHFGTDDYKKHVSLFRKLIALYDFKRYSTK